MKVQREDDSGGSMHAPEEHADSVLGCVAEIQIPEQHFPIQGPTLDGERCAERTAVRTISGVHVALKLMTGNQFMKYSCAREWNIVAAHAHHLLFVSHADSRIRNADHFAASEEWIHELTLGCHHLHPPGLDG